MYALTATTDRFAGKLKTTLLVQKLSAALTADTTRPRAGLNSEDYRTGIYRK